LSSAKITLLASAAAPWAEPGTGEALDPIKLTLLALFGLAGVGFAIYWIAKLAAGWSSGEPDGALAPDERLPGADTGPPTPLQLGIGALTDFLDTLGIGSFATTTALFRFLKQVPDRLIPGSLNVGHTLPTVVQAIIYTQIVKVDPITLVSMIAAAVAGAWLGAGFVASWPKRRIQLGMGCALFGIAVVIVIRQLYDLENKDAPTHLEGSLLAIGVAVNFVLGALMTIGIGLYAPCLVLISMLGMDTKAAFPIMMGSCALLMPLASLQFVRKRSYAPRASLGLTLGGIPAVLVAAYVVQDLPLYWLKWLVVVVVTYTSLTMLRDATRPPQKSN